MIWILIYQVFVVWLAYKNADWSNPEEEWKIKHWLNGLLHISASCYIWFCCEWNLGLANLLFIRVVFDTAYNIFMRNGLGYVTPDPESIIDKIEKWFVLRISEWLYCEKRNISDNDIERVAIGVRITILITAVILLFI